MDKILVPLRHLEFEIFGSRGLASSSLHLIGLVNPGQGKKHPEPKVFFKARELSNPVKSYKA